VTDQTPALEVNLTPVSNSTDIAASSSIDSNYSNQLHQQTLTEINLSENASNNNSTSITINPYGSGVLNGLPLESELPSYNEAVRIKKMETLTNELPPSYFDPTGEPRPAMHDATVSIFLEENF
jgi:hypothetical protein